MGLHLAITAREDFITQLLSFEDNIHTHITKLTIVDSPDANRENFNDLEVIERFNYNYQKFADVDWSTVDLYLYHDNLENLKYLMGAAAHSVFSIDLTGYSATLDQMPVILPRVDERQLEEVKEKKMCSLPHPQVSQLMYFMEYLHKYQQFMYVSVTNVFPVSYINDQESVKQLDKETREYFNFAGTDRSQHLAFDINALSDVAPHKQLNFEAQISRLLPNIDTVMVQNIVAPVFYGTTQLVTVGLTNSNTLDVGLVDEWYSRLTKFNGIKYRDKHVSARTFMSGSYEEDETLDIEEEAYADYLMEWGNLSRAEKLKWMSITDNTQLVVKQTIELINLFVAEEDLPR